MTVEGIQRVLLSLLPVYFYFVPEALFPVLYKKYIVASYRRLGGAQLDAFERIDSLGIRVSRILRFVAFLATIFVTVVTAIYSRNEHRWCFQECELLALLACVLGFTVWIVVVNVRRQFLVSATDEWLERITLFLTIPICYWWG